MATTRFIAVLSLASYRANRLPYERILSLLSPRHSHQVTTLPPLYIVYLYSLYFHLASSLVSLFPRIRNTASCLVGESGVVQIDLFDRNFSLPNLSIKDRHPVSRDRSGSPRLLDVEALDARSPIDQARTARHGTL